MRYLMLLLALPALLIVLDEKSQAAPTAAAGTPTGQQTPAQQSGSNSSTLQSEAEVLVYQSAEDGVVALADEITDQLDPDPKKSCSFILNFPFAAEDIANLRTLRKQIALAQNCVDALKIAGDFQDEKDSFTKDIYNNPYVSSLPAAHKGGAATPPALAPGPIGDIANDFTQVGLIVQAVQSLLTLIQTFHSPYTTTGGSAGFDQTDVNMMLVHQLLRVKSSGKTKIKIYDFSEPILAPIGDAGDSPFLKSIQNLTGDVQHSYNKIAADNFQYSKEQDIEDFQAQVEDVIGRLQAPTGISSITDKTVEKILNEDLKKCLKLKRQLVLLRAATVTRPELHDVGAAKTTLNSVWAFIQILYGSVSVQTPLQSTDFSVQTTLPTKTPPATAPPASASTVISLGDGGSLTISLTAAPGTKTPSSPPPAGQPATAPPATQQSQTQAPGLGALNAPAFLSLVAKFDYLDCCTHKLSTGPTYYLNCKLSVGDSTQSKVTRFILEDYIALSNRAIVQLQAISAADGEDVFEGESKKFHNQVYFPSRVRDGAENQDKSKDELNPPAP